MPAATQYWDPLLLAQQRKLQNEAEEERRLRADWHKEAWKYYDGKHPKPLKPPPNGSTHTDNVIVNNTREAAVDTNSFAFPDKPILESATAQTEIDAFWKYWDLATWLNNAGLTGFLEGHVFISIMPPTDDEPLPRPMLLNPSNVTCYWSDDDYEKILWYEKLYSAKGEKRKQDILAPNTADNRGWQIRTYRMRGNQWELIEPAPDEAPIVDWEFNHPPIIDWQHTPRPFRYYGDHECHLELNDALNKVASDIKSILRYHAAPKAFGTGFDAGEITESATGSVMSVENENADLKLLEMESDLASSMNFLNFLDNKFMRQSRVTKLSGGPDAYKGITNLGIKAAFMSQVAKTETLHRQYGYGIGYVTMACMEILGYLIDEPTIKWVDALPVSDLEVTQVEQMRVGMGVESKETAAGNMGLSWDEEQEKIDDEQAAAASAMEQLSGAQAPLNPPQDNLRMRQQDTRGNGYGSS